MNSSPNKFLEESDKIAECGDAFAFVQHGGTLLLFFIVNRLQCRRIYYR